MTGTLVAHPPRWVNDYIGIPFVDYGRDRGGCDCWGLARMIWSERAALNLPEYGIDPNNGDLCEATMEINKIEWQRVVAGHERTLDGVQMLGCYGEGRQMRRAAMHVGVVVGDGWLIHAAAEVGAACLMRYRERAHAHNIVGFWRHIHLAGGNPASIAARA